MNEDVSQKIDEVAEDLDDMTTTVDELAESRPSPNAKTLERLKNGIEQASEAADDLENDLDA
jgi:ElaB/YqjD/DUF883 family membrane-anchored ribosome-binding protein